MNVASFSFPRHMMLARLLDLLSFLLPLRVSIQRKLPYSMCAESGSPILQTSINTNRERRVLLWVEPDSASVQGCRRAMTPC